MVNSSLLIERGYRLSSRDFSAAGGHCAIGDVPINGSNCRFDHLASKVRFGHNAVGFDPVIQIDGSFGPLGRLTTSRSVSEHPALAVVINARGHYAAFVCFFTPSTAGIDRHDNSPQFGSLTAPQVIELVAHPQGARNIEQQFAHQFLAAKSVPSYFFVIVSKNC